jgi:hypothetical protein
MSLNSINQLLFVTEKRDAFFAEGNEFLKST